MSHPAHLEGPCNYCTHVLSGSVIRHTIMECQYRQSMYCHVCMAYGHAPADCPNKTAWAVRLGKDPSKFKNLTITVEGGEEGVKEVLRKYGIKPGTRIQENRKLLRNLANSLKPARLVQFLTSS